MEICVTTEAPSLKSTPYLLNRRRYYPLRPTEGSTVPSMSLSVHVIHGEWLPVCDPRGRLTMP